MNDKVFIFVGLGVLFIIGFISDIKYKPKEPTLQQWVNRLIEHVEHENIDAAYHRFARLVQSGMEPAHAFEVVVSQ